MKKIGQAVVILLFFISLSISANSANVVIPAEDYILDQNLSKNVEKCNQNMQSLYQKLQPSTSAKRALTDTIRNTFGKDKKEDLKSEAKSKLRQFNQEEFEPERAAIIKLIFSANRKDMNTFQNLMDRIDSLGNKCEEATKKITKEVGSALN